MSRVVEKYVAIVTRNDGDEAACDVFDDSIHIDDVHIFRKNDESPERFLQTLPAGRELDVQRVLSPRW